MIPDNDHYCIIFYFRIKNFITFALSYAILFSEK